MTIISTPPPPPGHVSELYMHTSITPCAPAAVMLLEHNHYHHHMSLSPHHDLVLAAAAVALVGTAALLSPATHKVGSTSFHLPLTSIIYGYCSVSIRPAVCVQHL